MITETVFCSAKSAYKDYVVKADDLVKERGIQSEGHY